MRLNANHTTETTTDTEEPSSDKHSSTTESVGNENNETLDIEAALAYRDSDESDHDPTTKEAMCQTPSCHDTIDAARVMTDTGVKTLCRACRKHFIRRSSS